MKIGIYLLMLIGFMTCKSAKLEKNPPFQINGATYNNWVGGQQGVSGMKVIISYTSEQPITFEKILFQNRETKLEMKEQKGKKYLVGFFDTSTRKGRELIMDKDPKKEMQNKPPKKEYPFELKENEAVISYMDGNKLMFTKVEKIKKTDTDFYP